MRYVHYDGCEEIFSRVTKLKYVCLAGLMLTLKYMYKVPKSWLIFLIA
jgi:hypothetical protein